MRKVVRFILLASTLSGVIAAVKPAWGKPVAVVNKDTITVEELEQKLKARSDSSLAGKTAEAVKSELLTEAIIDKLVRQKAGGLNLSKDSVFRENKMEHLIKFIFDKMYQKYVADLVKVTEEDVEKQYQQNRETLYQIVDQVRVSHILIEPKEDSSIKGEKKRKQLANQAASNKAKEVKKRAESEEFATLASMFSNDLPTANRGGAMGFQKRGQMLPDFDAAAFKAKPGDILGPIRSQYGYHILKVTDRRYQGYLEYTDSLKAGIQERLTAEGTSRRNQAFLDSLRNQASYEFNDRILDLPDTAKVDEKVWGVIVNGQDTVTAKQAREELLNYTVYTKAKELGYEEKKNFLRQKSVWVQLMVLQNVAKGLGYFGLPEVKQEEKKFTLEQAEKKIRQAATSNYTPSQEEIRHYFETHPEMYKQEFPLHVFHIIFDDSITAAAVRDTVLEGADYLEMAQKYYPGGEEIKQVAYDLGYISPFEMPEGFYEAANRLQIGEISPPFKTFLGYHLIKLIDRKKDQTVEELKPQITRILKEEQQKKFKAEWEVKLKKGAKIKVYQEELDRLDLSRLNSSPPAGQQKQN